MIWFPWGSLHGLWQALDKLFLYFFMEMLWRRKINQKAFPDCSLVVLSFTAHQSRNTARAGPRSKIDDTFLSSDNEVLILCCFLCCCYCLCVRVCEGTCVTNCSYRKGLFSFSSVVYLPWLPPGKIKRLLWRFSNSNNWGYEIMRDEFWELRNHPHLNLI